MAFQASANLKNTSTLRLSKADERLAKELALFDYKPDDSFVSFKVLCALFSRSPSSGVRDVKAGRLPAPVKVGSNSNGYNVGAVRKKLREKANTNTNFHNASPVHFDQLGHNGVPPLDDVVEKGDLSGTNAGTKKRGGENG